MTKEEFLERAREKHGYKYQYPTLGEKVVSNDTIDVMYQGVLYKQKVVKHLLLGRCPEKNTHALTTDKFIEMARKKWGDKYDYSLVEYQNSNTPIKIIFEGVVFEQLPLSHLRHRAERNMNQEYFIKKSMDRWGDKYDYSLVKYVHCKSKVKIIYKKTGEIFEQTPDLHLNCAPENIRLSVRKTTEQFVKEANEVHDNKYSYEKTEYVKNQIKVIITCPVHGDFNQSPLSHIQGNGCPYCSESRGERSISNYLDKLDISYYRQYKFDDCRNVFSLPFDFYVPKYRLLIEFDGQQHFEPMKFFGGVEAFERLRENDRIKNEYCEENYIDLLRIKYDQVEMIAEILERCLGVST